MATRTITQKCGLNDCTGLVEPLVTQFIPPPDCVSVFPFRIESLGTSATCYPPDFAAIWAGYGYYSPGLCPEGYTAGCTVTADGFVSDYNVQPDESAYWCVPSQWDCGDGRWATTASPRDQVPALQIRWKSSDLDQLQINPFGTDDTTPPPPRTTKTTVSQQSSPSSPSAGATSAGQSANSTPTDNHSRSLITQPTPSPTSSPVDLPPKKQPVSDRLSAGAKAGIAIGAVLAAVLLCALLAWLLRRRIRKRTSSTNIITEPDAPNLDGRPISELDGKRPLCELEGKRPMSELNGMAPIPELDGDRGGGPTQWHQAAVLRGLQRPADGIAELEGDPFELVINTQGGDVGAPGSNWIEHHAWNDRVGDPTVALTSNAEPTDFGPQTTETLAGSDVEVELDPYQQVHNDNDHMRENERERALQALNGSSS